MRRGLCIIILLWLCAVTSAEVMTREGALALSTQGSQISSQLFTQVANRTTQSPGDEEARRQLRGISETLQNLRSEFQAGVIAPRSNLLLLQQCHSKFQPVYQSLPLSDQERSALTRLLEILTQLDEYARQNNIGASPESASQPPPPVSIPQTPPSTGSTPDWCQISTEGKVSAVEVPSPAPLPAGVQSLTPCLKIVPQEQATVITLRFRLSQPPAAPDNVAVAFYSGEDSRWVVHAASYEPASNEVVATVNHASAWQAVLAPAARATRASAHFQVHYYAGEVSEPEVDRIIVGLENSRRHLQALNYYLENKKLDVYLTDLPDKGGFEFGGHRLGATGSYIELNLPRKLSALGTNVIQATLVHELFHEMQLVFYQRINSYGARLLESTRKRRGQFSYGWLNELLSSWVELDMIHAHSFPPLNSQLYAYSNAFHTLGLKTTNTDAGYGGSYFLDHLTRVYGDELVHSVLKACRRQGPLGVAMGQNMVYNDARNGYAALQQGIKDRASIVGIQNTDQLDELWKRYIEQVLTYELKNLDPRVKRRLIFPKKATGTISEGKNLKVSYSLPPVSLGILIPLRVKPGSGPDGATKVTVKQQVSGSVEVHTLLYLSTSLAQSSENAILAKGSRKISEIQGSGSKGGNVTFQPGQNEALVLIAPVALDGTGKSQVDVEIVCEAPGVKQKEPETSTPTSGQGTYRPAVHKIYPEKARINQRVTIVGTGFGPPPPNLPRKLTLFGGTAVVFRTQIVGKPAEIEAQVLSWGPNSITVLVPPANYGYAPLSVGVYRDRFGSNFIPFKLEK
jgi:hypothetical protein